LGTKLLLTLLNLVILFSVPFPIPLPFSSIFPSLIKASKDPTCKEVKLSLLGLGHTKVVSISMRW
jgi:hypothetical protein